MKRGVYDYRGEVFAYADGEYLYDLDGKHTGYISRTAVYDLRRERIWHRDRDGLYDLHWQSIGYIGSTDHDDQR
ncbi:MAG: 4-fold beta flower protein [Anaerolineales bacterium]